MTENHQMVVASSILTRYKSPPESSVYTEHLKIPGRHTHTSEPFRLSPAGQDTVAPLTCSHAFEGMILFAPSDEIWKRDRVAVRAFGRIC